MISTCYPDNFRSETHTYHILQLCNIKHLFFRLFISIKAVSREPRHQASFNTPTFSILCKFGKASSIASVPESIPFQPLDGSNRTSLNNRHICGYSIRRCGHRIGCTALFLAPRILKTCILYIGLPWLSLVPLYNF